MVRFILFLGFCFFLLYHSSLPTIAELRTIEYENIKFVINVSIECQIGAPQSTGGHLPTEATLDPVSTKPRRCLRACSQRHCFPWNNCYWKMELKLLAAETKFQNDLNCLAFVIDLVDCRRGPT